MSYRIKFNDFLKQGPGWLAIQEFKKQCKNSKAEN